MNYLELDLAEIDHLFYAATYPSMQRVCLTCETSWNAGHPNEILTDEKRLCWLCGGEGLSRPSWEQIKLKVHRQRLQKAEST